MDEKPDQEAARDRRRPYGILSDDPSGLLRGAGWRAFWAVLREAVLRLWNDDAMGLAGNIAFRALLAIFPFLIFISSLTAFIGDRGMADGLVAFLIAILPSALVEPLVSEIMKIMTTQRGGVLSIGGLLTIWFALGGVDGVRVGLNRAYGISETRSVFVIFALEVLIVVFAGLAFVLVSYLLVLAPWAGGLLHQLVPEFEVASVTSRLIRYPVSAAILVVALFAAHTFLPARRSRFSSMWPGILFTVSAWAVIAAAFSYYLSSFANYVDYYAGLAGIIAGIYFLYLAALVLLFGGELNRAIRIRRLARRRAKSASSSGP